MRTGTSKNHKKALPTARSRGVPSKLPRRALAVAPPPTRYALLSADLRHVHSMLENNGCCAMPLGLSEKLRGLRVSLSTTRAPNVESRCIPPARFPTRTVRPSLSRPASWTLDRATRYLRSVRIASVFVAVTVPTEQDSGPFACSGRNSERCAGTRRCIRCARSFLSAHTTYLPPLTFRN